MTTRMLTGATGLVGGAVVLELLDRTEDDVFALVRGRDSADSRERLHRTLISLAHGYGRSDLAEAVRTRTHAVVGDISEPGCGITVGRLPAIDEIWHSAASLQYEEEYRPTIERLNVGGTRNVLQVARDLGVTGFHYISTAYVAGSSTGLVKEGPVLDLSPANNCYEETKIQAEALVHACAEEFRARILRPSIVVGHSRTRHGINWSGMYGFARQVMVFQKLAERKVGTLLSHARLRLLADPELPLNLVPVDVVARNAVSIALSDSPEMYFHLANSTPPPIRDVIVRILSLIGLREPLWVRDKDGFTALDEQLDKGMDFYASYMKNRKTFDMTNTEAVCGKDAGRAPMDDEQVTEYVRYYLRRQRGFDEDALPVRTLHPAVL